LKFINATLVVLFFASCDGFVGEVTLKEPTGPPIAVVNADYVVLRPITSTITAGAVGDSLYGQTLYFIPSERILDLRHLDLRTAKIEEQSGRYVVSIRTNPEGDQLVGAWTSANLEKRLGVFLDGRLVEAPVIKSRIAGMIVIDGDFTKSQADAVLARLRRGGASTGRSNAR
jgi:preprotein translocase subunit SecD